QVLYNLLTNALKFTGTGGSVRVRLAREGQEAVVRVEDTGIGLTPAQMERLFQPFGQVHDASARTRGGTGLGLYISKGLVEAHGGRIEVASAGPGQGATFSVRVPLAEG
ncbi:MAG: hypothetical protein LC624_10155, partial [Halobacteriales archaeon]|nr:hypothetical protein [Halobacteriales archaeon]